MSTREEQERPLVRLAGFAALALYGLERWATLLHPVPGWRLAGLGAVAVIVAGGGPALRARSRTGALLGVALALLAVFPLAGLPLAWVTHLRVAVSVAGIGEGLGALPRVLLPYIGINEWVRTVIALGAGALLLDAALLLAFAARPLGDLRRAGAALPLVALAVVPSTLIRPQLPYLQGLLLFALLAAFMWGERARGDRLAGAVAIGGVAGVLATLVSPGLDQRRPWIDYQALAGTLAATHVESFDWSQRYGPIDWPRLGREVLDVRAVHPDYWKAENLELFNGTAWVPGQVAPAPAPQPSAPAAGRSTQTIQVTIRAMRTTDVIAAGVASRPVHVPGGAAENVSPGTWTAGTELGPGDSYTVRTYSPRPPANALAAPGERYPDQALSGERSISLPPSSASAGPVEIVFAPFGASGPVQRAGAPGGDGRAATAIIRASPYARAFALARRLARRASTPYAFVRGAERYLSAAQGFRYDENPPRSRYPLERFLFGDRRGYCQQFSGAMALLLRMGGVPARVSAGFTSGSYDAANHHWVVSDLDAHSWVEAWFPRYGWVRFDPTPVSAPARGGAAPLPALRGARAAIVSHARSLDQPRALRTARAPERSGGSSISAIAVALAAAIAGAMMTLVGVMLRGVRRRRTASGEQLVAELERALARCGRPIDRGVTLAALEHRFRSSPSAAGYVRALRLARFGGAGELPTTTQRRALRGELRAGLGVLGLLRALWALPPGGARHGQSL